jgi:hypothetical protein
MMVARLLQDAQGTYRSLSRGRPLLLPVMFLLSASAAMAQVSGGPSTGTVWRCIDSSGHARYTNVASDTAGQQCSVVTREIMVAPSGAPAVKAPASALQSGAGDAAGQRSREDARRRILEDELKNEQAALARARELLGEQESLRNGDERNYQRVLERLKPFQDAVNERLKNVEALEREVGRLK